MKHLEPRWNFSQTPGFSGVDKRMLLKLVFAERLTHVRDEGFRTANFLTLKGFRETRGV